MLKNALMVQGTTSDAGKSTLVAGLCRAFLNRGKRVCPFKPQNMALNSAVTEDGGEIGRAQALQAAACKIDSHTDMNPVLLKPTSDMGAQVIIQGKAIDSMQAQAFHDYKRVAKGAVLDSFLRLNKQYDFVLVEGAGSPAEINLRKGDIANMGFAEAVDCPVIIVADIDKGGVFAHLVGTLELLSPSEQKRVMGFVINKFRGDITLLQPGLDWLEVRTGKPVFGVVPYLHDLFLDAEDAVQFNQNVDDAKLKVVVPILPHTSNHTDFDTLRSHPEIELSFISISQELPACDLLILPGSKNVRGDYQYLVHNHWDKKIKKHLRYGGKLMGICGGYQMLGESISDPEGIESKPGETQGFGLIPMRTTLKKEKLLERNQIKLTLEGKLANIKAYEIHCGLSEFTASVEQPFVDHEEKRHGFISEDKQILGSYYHGLIDTGEALSLISEWAGETISKTQDLNLQREKEIEKLADCIEKSVDIDALMKRLNSENESNA
jgi:adenosylcobyric acid synthase